MNINNVTRFATDRLDDLKKIGGAISNEVKYAAGQLRDKTIVPALDKGIESGFIPADSGMFGRYLTGTEVPLTRMPPSIREHESLLAQEISSSSKKYNEYQTKLPKAKKRLAQLQSERDQFPKDQTRAVELFNNMWNSDFDIKKHNMGFENYSPEQVKKFKDSESELNLLKKKWPRLNTIEPDISKVDLSNKTADSAIAGAQSEVNKYSQFKKYKDLDPNNYFSDSSTSYQGIGGVTNTLGQYTVKDGIVEDRYDFNEFSKPGDKWVRQGFVSNGQEGIRGALVKHGGRLAHHLGLIKPGSGYDVRLDTGRK